MPPSIRFEPVITLPLYWSISPSVRGVIYVNNLEDDIYTNCIAAAPELSYIPLDAEI